MIAKKITPPKTHSQEFDREREYAVVLERLEGNLKVFAEGQTILTKKVDIMYEEMGRQREDIGIIKTDVRFLKEDVNGLKEGQKTLSDKFDHFAAVTHKRLSRLEEIPR